MDISGVDVEIDVIKEYPELEDLVVNPSLEDQNFNSSKYGFKSVKINAIKGEELDLNPTTEQQSVEGVFTKVKVNAIKTQKLNTIPSTQEQVITGLFDEVTVNAIEGQELNLNPSEEQQSFEGVFLGVNVNPIQVEEITTDLDFSSADAIELTAQEGAYIKKATINKDENLSPENIKSGVTVCGVSGDVADTSDADATSDDIAEGKTAYVNNEKVVGTMEVNTNNAEIYVPNQWVTKFSFQSLLKKIDLTGVDMLGVLNYTSAFGNYSYLEEVVGIDTSNATTMNSMFYGCTELRNVDALNTNNLKTTNSMTSMFERCPKLTEESLNNVLQTCINAINYTGTKTLAEVGLTETQATTCTTLSNYQAFLDAGWVTGY